MKKIPLIESIICIVAIVVAAFMPLGTLVLPNQFSQPNAPQQVTLATGSGTLVATIDIPQLTITTDGVHMLITTEINSRNVHLTPFGISIPNWILGLVAFAYLSTSIIKSVRSIKILSLVSILFLSYGMFHFGYMIYIVHTKGILGIGSMVLLGSFIALIICSIIEFLPNKLLRRSTSRVAI